jgi:hypothetical protein
MNRIRFSFLAAALVGALTGACNKKCKDCPPPAPAVPCPSVNPATTPPPSRPDPEPPMPGSAGGGGGPGACTEGGCMVNKHVCSMAKCLTPPTSGAATAPSCEYGPTLTDGCRCHRGDKRQCGGTGTWKTCVEVNDEETKWGPCI